MQTDDAAAIRGVNLAKKFRSGQNDLVIFAGLNLEIARGERLALVGESGAGKSTLLHLLGGLDRPTEGAIYFGQNDICQFSRKPLAEFRNRELGFVWQIHSLLAEFTALENVMMPLLIRGQSRDRRSRYRWRGWMKWAYGTARHIARGNYRGASSSAWCWRGRWWEIRVFCWPTSPPAAWISGPAK